MEKEPAPQIRLDLGSAEIYYGYWCACNHILQQFSILISTPHRFAELLLSWGALSIYILLWILSFKVKYKDLSPPLFIEEVAQAKRCDGGVKPVRLFFVQESPCNILQHHSQPRYIDCDSRICYANRQHHQQLVVRSADEVCTARDAKRRYCQFQKAVMTNFVLCRVLCYFLSHRK